VNYIKNYHIYNPPDDVGNASNAHFDELHQLGNNKGNINL